MYKTLGSRERGWEASLKLEDREHSSSPTTASVPQTPQETQVSLPLHNKASTFQNRYFRREIDSFMQKNEIPSLLPLSKIMKFKKQPKFPRNLKQSHLWNSCQVQSFCFSLDSSLSLLISVLYLIKDCMVSVSIIHVINYIKTYYAFTVFQNLVDQVYLVGILFGFCVFKVMISGRQFKQEVTMRTKHRERKLQRFFSRLTQRVG